MILERGVYQNRGFLKRGVYIIFEDCMECLGVSGFERDKALIGENKEHPLFSICI